MVRAQAEVVRVVEVTAQAAAKQGPAVAATAWVVAVTPLAAADSVLEEVEMVAEAAMAAVVGMVQVAEEREEVAMAAAVGGH